MFSVLYKYTCNYSLSEPDKASQMEIFKSCLNRCSQFLLKGASVAAGDFGARIYSGSQPCGNRESWEKVKAVTLVML
jgi:hypothetical protein